MLSVKAVVRSAIFCIFGMTALSGYGWASVTMPAAMPTDTSRFQVSVYGGGADTTMNPSTLQGLSETDKLQPNNNDKMLLTGGIGGAYRFILPAANRARLRDIALGLDLMYLKTTQTGYVWLFEQPGYNNYYFRMPVSSLRLMVDTEFTFRSIAPNLYPFLEGGIGVARNTTSYYDTPLIAGTFGTSIGSHIQYQFAYTLGAGFKIPLPYNSEFSFRFLYADLGKAETSKAAPVTLVAPVNLKLYSRTWLIGLTHFI